MEPTEQWVEQLKKGDKEAFNHLVKKFYAACLRKATAYTKEENTAKDLVQEALVQAYLSIDKLEDTSKFQAWLMGILRNVCNNYHRRKQNPHLNLPDELFQVPEETLAVEENESIKRRVRNAISQLSHKNKEVIEAFYFDNLSIEEIARYYDLSVSATKVRLHRARKALKYTLTLPLPSTSNSNTINNLPQMSTVSMQIDYFQPNVLYPLPFLKGEKEKSYWERMVCVAA